MSELIEQNNGRVEEWEDIQWNIPKRYVRRIQEWIFRATRLFPIETSEVTRIVSGGL